MHWLSNLTCESVGLLAVSETVRQPASESLWGLEPEPAELSIVYGSGRVTEPGKREYRFTLPVCRSLSSFRFTVHRQGEYFSNSRVCVEVRTCGC